MTGGMEQLKTTSKLPQHEARDEQVSMDRRKSDDRVISLECIEAEAEAEAEAEIDSGMADGGRTVDDGQLRGSLAAVVAATARIANYCVRGARYNQWLPHTLY